MSVSSKGDGDVRTFCPLLLAALMRDVMLAMFSVSCFARWGLMCISSAMVVVSVREVACDAGRFRAARRQGNFLWRSQPCRAEAPPRRERDTKALFTSATDTFAKLAQRGRFMSSVCLCAVIST